MKKRMSLLLAIMLLAITVLAACGGGGTAEQPPSQGDQTEQTPPAEGDGEETTEPPAESGDESQGYFEAEDPSLNPATALNRKDTLVVGMTAPKGVFNPFYWQTAYDKYVVDAIFDSSSQFKATERTRTVWRKA